MSVTEALIGRGLLRKRDGAYLMEPEGAAEFGAFGIDIGGLESRNRPLLRLWAWTGASAVTIWRAASASA